MEGSRPENNREGSEIQLADISEALRAIRSDAANLLKDMLTGITMWGITAVTAFILAAVWLALAQVIVTYAHPYGAPYDILDIFYASYCFAAASASLGVVLSWRYFSLRRRYLRLFEIAGKLR